MTTAIQNKPVETLREIGGLKATIWKNSSSKGQFYSTEFSRTYRTEDGYRNSRSFHDGDLLALARLAQKAHDKLAELKATAAAEQQAAQ